MRILKFGLLLIALSGYIVLDSCTQKETIMQVPFYDTTYVQDTVYVPPTMDTTFFHLDHPTFVHSFQQGLIRYYVGSRYFYFTNSGKRCVIRHVRVEGSDGVLEYSFFRNIYHDSTSGVRIDNFEFWKYYQDSLIVGGTYVVEYTVTIGTAFGAYGDSTIWGSDTTTVLVSREMILN